MDSEAGDEESGEKGQMRRTGRWGSSLVWSGLVRRGVKGSRVKGLEEESSVARDGR